MTSVPGSCWAPFRMVTAWVSTSTRYRMDEPPTAPAVKMSGPVSGASGRGRVVGSEGSGGVGAVPYVVKVFSETTAPVESRTAP